MAEVRLALEALLARVRTGLRVLTRSKVPPLQVPGTVASLRYKRNGSFAMEITPQAMAIPKSTEHLEKGKYGPIFPKTPACYGFTIIATVKQGRAELMRSYGQRVAEALKADPGLLAPLKLHYLRWVLFDNDTRFMYQGIFDTDFDKYTEDAVVLFTKSGINTAFENLEGFPMDWKTNTPAFVQFLRDHQCNSFLEYGEYPYVTSDEIKKALKVKAALAEMLEQMQ
ncbi:MAG: hypothetical protein ACJ8AT_31790 [Hyalangium sp.]|uniref:hypothetical protein n=1 Tax=Hyalangium sp. TaxID=2028555 RepID=UPI00389A8F9F